MGSEEEFSSKALKKKITQAMNLAVIVAKTLNKKENEVTKDLKLLFFSVFYCDACDALKTYILNL